MDQFRNQDYSPEPTQGGSGGSLPDLTNVEFSCGLDVPLEQDDDQTSVGKAPFPSPSRCGSGPSKLMYSLSPRATSPTMMYQPVDQRGLSTLGQSSACASAPYSLPGTILPPTALDRMQTGSTMPDFSSAAQQHAAPPPMQHSASSTFPVQQFRPFPSHPQHAMGGFPHTESLPNFARSISVETPPVTIIINSPFADSAVSISGPEHHQASLRRTQSAASTGITNGVGSGSACSGSGGGIGIGGSGRVPFSSGSGTQQNHTPFFIGHPSNTLPVLPSYLEAKQQQALQQRFASISMTKSDIIRSYSEENLQKIPKEKGDLIQQNPFMGNLANANSVPCVYVESPNNDIQRYKSDSPAAVDSPSTTPSYASSPPSVRPYWIDHPNSMNVFVFNEWPAEAVGDKGAGGKGGSPLSHHRSLTDLSTIPEAGEAATSSRRISLLHQLSLPSIALSDLVVDEHMDRQSGLLPLTPPDFEMEEEVVDSLLKEQLPQFDVSSFLASHRP